MEDLKNLLSQATRSNVKQFLNTQREKIEADLARLQKSEQERLERLKNANTTATIGGYTKKM